jgi:HK97 family phage major capsid protein
VPAGAPFAFPPDLVEAAVDRLKELEVDLGDRRARVKEILAAAQKDKRPLSEDDREKAATLTAEIDQIQATIKLEEQALAWERPESPAPSKGRGEERQHPRPSAQRLGGAKNPWGDCSTDQGMQAAFGNFLQAVAKFSKGETPDPRLIQTPNMAASGLNTSVGSEGGFLVRTDFSQALLDRAMEDAVLANRCTTIDIGDGADGIELPYVDETSRATGSRWGGVQVYRRAEADTVTASKPKFGLLEIRLEDLMGICYTTDRAMRDATSLGQIIQKAFASEFSFKVDDEIIRGTGVGQALGLLNSPALVSVAKETSQVAATLVAENVIKMRSRLRARNRMNSVWYINQELETQLPQMNIKIKNVAGTENVGGFGVYMPANGLSGQQYDTLFGKPVIPIEQCEALGTKGDIFHCDLSEYLLIRKGALETQESIHVRFLYGENTFRFTYRINGAPAWKTSLTPYKGSATQSPFITLDTRS